MRSPFAVGWQAIPSAVDPVDEPFQALTALRQVSSATSMGADLGLQCVCSMTNAGVEREEERC